MPDNFVIREPKLYKVGLGMGYLELPQGTCTECMFLYVNKVYCIQVIFKFFIDLSVSLNVSIHCCNHIRFN